MSGVGLDCVPPCTGVICGIADIMRSDADGGATRRRRRFILVARITWALLQMTVRIYGSTQQYCLCIRQRKMWQQRRVGN
jgi:hypothetical protein